LQVWLAILMHPSAAVCQAAVCQAARWPASRPSCRSATARGALIGHRPQRVGQPQLADADAALRRGAVPELAIPLHISVTKDVQVHDSKGVFEVYPPYLWTTLGVTRRQPRQVLDLAGQIVDCQFRRHSRKFIQNQVLSTYFRDFWSGAKKWRQAISGASFLGISQGF
jgi:hypothetical protein